MSRIFRTTLRLDPDKPASAQAAPYCDVFTRSADFPTVR